MGQTPFCVLFTSRPCSDVIAYELFYKSWPTPCASYRFIPLSLYHSVITVTLQDGLCRCRKRGPEWFSHLSQGWREAEQNAGPKHLPFLYSPLAFLSQAPCLAIWGPVATELVSLETHQPSPSVYSSPFLCPMKV